MEEEQDQESKTEDPTPRQIEEAKKRGQVINSKEVTNFVMLLSLTLMIYLVLPGKSAYMVDYLKHFIEHNHEVQFQNYSPLNMMEDILYNMFLVLGLPLLFLIISIIFSTFVQQEGQINISYESMIPKLSKISILEGFKRIFSLKSVVELIKGIIKLTIVGCVLYYIIVKDAKYYAIFYQFETAQFAMLMFHLVLDIMISVCVITFVIAIFDYFYQRYEYYNSLKMTKQQLKEEYKETEGNPEVRAKIKSMRMEKVKNRMMANIGKADVVITNPTHYSIAIEYKSATMKTPVVIAKGQDFIALRIRELAKEYDIPLVENAPLARSLYETVKVDQEIKIEHYEAVAKIISYVYKLKKKRY
jgi:flagellar biosynthetic protein FlhB